MNRQERVTVHNKQDRLQITSGVPKVGDIQEGVPVLRKTGEGLVRYTKYKNTLYKEVLGRAEVTPSLVASTVTQSMNTCIFIYGDYASRSADYYLYGAQLQQFSSDVGFAMHRGGSIVGHSTRLEIEAATSGNDVTLEVRINDTNQALLENVFLQSGGTGYKTAYVSITKGLVTFSAGDLIQVHATEDGDMGWDDVLGFVEVAFDA